MNPLFARLMAANPPRAQDAAQGANELFTRLGVFNRKARLAGLEPYHAAGPDTLGPDLYAYMMREQQKIGPPVRRPSDMSAFAPPPPDTKGWKAAKSSLWLEPQLDPYSAEARDPVAIAEGRVPMVEDDARQLGGPKRRKR